MSYLVRCYSQTFPASRGLCRRGKNETKERPLLAANLKLRKPWTYKNFGDVDCVVTNRSEDKGIQAKNTLCKNTDYAKQKKQIKVVDNNVSTRGLSISVCLFCLFHSLCAPRVKISLQAPFKVTNDASRKL